MAKWDKNTFIEKAKDTCYPHISNILIDLVNFADNFADTISWGKGRDCGMMIYKCKSDDFGMVPLFHLTTRGQIKFHLNSINYIFDSKQFQISILKSPPVKSL